MKKALWVLPVLGLMAGCATTKVAEPAPAPAPAPAPVVQPAPAPAPAPAPVKLDPINDPNSPLYKDKAKVYFDFDKYDIKAEYQGLVQAHGAYAGQNADKKIRVEGNADERGSREYNLALGQKRAEAVKKGLAAAGANEGQLEAVSNGKEKPKAEGHDEAAWAENRRADIVYN